MSIECLKIKNGLMYLHKHKTFRLLVILILVPLFNSDSDDENEEEKQLAITDAVQKLTVKALQEVQTSQPFNLLKSLVI